MSNVLLQLFFGHCPFFSRSRKIASILFFCARLMYSFANRIWIFLIVGEFDSSCFFCTLYHRGFLKYILSALFCAFCMIDMTVCNWFSQQAVAYRNRGRIQDLYSRSKLSCSTLRLLRSCRRKIRLFALLVMSLQFSFLFSCGVVVIPKNFMVFASLICFPLMFIVRLVCRFEGFLNSMYFVLAGFILIFNLSHHFMRVLSEAWILFCINWLDFDL